MDGGGWGARCQVRSSRVKARGRIQGALNLRASQRPTSGQLGGLRARSSAWTVSGGGGAGGHRVQRDQRDVGRNAASSCGCVSIHGANQALVRGNDPRNPGLHIRDPQSTEQQYVVVVVIEHFENHAPERRPVEPGARIVLPRRIRGRQEPPLHAAPHGYAQLRQKFDGTGPTVSSFPRCDLMSRSSRVPGRWVRGMECHCAGVEMVRRGASRRGEKACTTKTAHMPVDSGISVPNLALAGMPRISELG